MFKQVLFVVTYAMIHHTWPFTYRRRKWSKNRNITIDLGSNKVWYSATLPKKT